jgi:hypothetical protein
LLCFQPEIITLAALTFADENAGGFPLSLGGDDVSVLALGYDGTNCYDLLMPHLGSPQLWHCLPPRRELGGLMPYHLNSLISTTSGLKTSEVRFESENWLH